jgi:hypothetical protein
MLLGERPYAFSDPEWIYELKYDGYRVLASWSQGTARLRSRNGADATKWFPVSDRRNQATLESAYSGHLMAGQCCPGVGIYRPRGSRHKPASAESA